MLEDKAYHTVIFKQKMKEKVRIQSSRKPAELSKWKT